MQPIPTIKLEAVTAFIGNNHPDIKGSPVNPSPPSEERDTRLKDTIGRALTVISNGNDLSNPEITLLIRLNALYLGQNLGKKDSALVQDDTCNLSTIIQRNFFLPGEVDFDYLDVNKLENAYRAIYNSEYSKIRKPQVPYPLVEDPNTFTAPESEKIEVKNKPDNEFIHHSARKVNREIPFTRTKAEYLFKSVLGGEYDRYSLNVNVTQALINELDKFILYNPGSFKFSKNPGKRHDSITFYSDLPLDKEQEVRLAEIIQPFVRSDDLIGEEIIDKDKRFPGIRKEVSPSYKSVLSLKTECLKLDPLILFALDLNDSVMSTGRYAAVSNMLTLIKSGLPKELFE